MPSETLGRNNVYKVDYKDTCTYAVDMTYKSNKDCGFTLYANATPRFPIPEATYKLEQRDCGNYITFTNTSHIRTHNWKTGEDVDTPLRPEYIGWSFDGLSPVFDTPEALWNPSFRLPDEEADYHFLLYAGVGLCDSVQKLNIHVPAVGPDSVVDKVQRCAGDIYYHYGKPYTKDTLIKDRDYNMAGCDSLHVTDLRFVDAIHDTIDATITDQESYIFNGQTLTSSGEYSAGPFVSIAGCDSMVLLRLTVVVTLAMELTAVEQPCYGATSFLIETHARRGLPNHYSLTYDEVGTTAGLKPQSGDLIDGNDNTLIIPIPPEVKPGYYPFTILFGSKENGTDKQTSELVLHYPASLICQRWDDVLGILNAEHNGGYDFQYFQWYRNGEPIDGATQPYYYLESKLQPGDIYTVELKENADERGLTTCGYIVHATAATPVAAPQRLLRGGQLYITVNGRTYNALGGIVE